MNPSIPSHTHAPDMCNPIRKVRDEQGAITWPVVTSKSSRAPPLDSSSPLLEIFRPMIQQHQQTRSGKAVFGICKMFDVTISSILNIAGWLGFLRFVWSWLLFPHPPYFFTFSMIWPEIKKEILLKLAPHLRIPYCGKRVVLGKEFPEGFKDSFCPENGPIGSTILVAGSKLRISKDKWLRPLRPQDVGEGGVTKEERAIVWEERWRCSLTTYTLRRERKGDFEEFEECR